MLVALKDFRLIGHTHHEWTSFCAMDDIFALIREKIDTATALELSTTESSSMLTPASAAASRDVTLTAESSGSVAQPQK